MRRRIAAGITPRQDVCLFCAFRSTLDTSSRLERRHVSIRGYSSSSTRLYPAGASAARRQEREDDDDDEPPMLKQNANLASAFPLRQRNTIPPQSSQVPAKEPQSSEPSRITRQPKGEQGIGNGEPVFRNNFSAFTRKGNPGQGRRNQENDSITRGKSGFTAEERRDQKSGKQPKQRASRSMFAQDSTADRKPPSFESVDKMRPFMPFRQDVKNSTESVDTSNSRSNQDQRYPSRPHAQRGRYQQQGDQDNSSTIFRRVSSLDQNGYTENRIKQQKESASENVSSPDDLDVEAGGTQNFEILPPSSVDSIEEIDGRHHRRTHRADKKKSRSARFEDEEAEADDVASAPAPAFGRDRGSTQRRRLSGRTTEFDHEMAEVEEALYGDQSRRKKKNKSQKVPKSIQARPSIKLSEFMSVGQLAKALSVQLEPFISRLEEEGFEGARYDHILDAQTSSMFADLYGFEPVVATENSVVDLVARPPPEDASMLPPRPPIVTIMGHVDHGKTTILDFLRKSSVVATEHGGITQHIGAFSVTMPGTNRQITFLDTPGHAAFLEMRRRGANVTDIVVLVVAADDSVKPQTIEAIKHAIEAKVQIVVAINKVDKEDANVERVKQDLTRHEIIVEDYGGDFQAIPVSGKTGQGMAELEEAIITLAEVHDYRAEKDGLAEGTIIESKVTAAGRVATVLVRRGTLRPGDFIVAGTTWARVRTLRDDTGALVKEAPPGAPVQVDGWRGEDPTAGLEVLQAEDEEQAKDVLDYRIEQRENARASVDMSAINEARSEEAEARAKVLAWEAEQEWSNRSHVRRPKDNVGWVEPEAAGGPKQVHFVVKADVAGSVEAVVAAVSAVGNNEIVANVVHSGTGSVTEFDIRMLATTGETGYVISFNQHIDGAMYRLAEAADLQILDHNIIYKVTDVVKEKLAEQLPPIVTQKVLGEAEVGQIFDITVKRNKVKIAGCKVTNGTISRANKIRVLRDNSVVYTGTLDSLKNVKKDVTEMRKGTECGMGFDDWEDFQEGDQIQCFEEREEKRTLY